MVEDSPFFAPGDLVRSVITQRIGIILMVDMSQRRPVTVIAQDAIWSCKAWQLVKL